MHRLAPFRFVIPLLICSSLIGCGPSEKPDYGIKETGEGEQGEGTDVVQGEGETTEPKKPLLEPFDPPTLADLDKETKWKKGLVVDTFERMRKWKAETKPLASIEDVLKLENKGDDDNQKIYSALSQFSPKDGAGVNYDDSFNHAAIMDLNSLNPVLTSSIVESDYHMLTAAALFGFDWNMVPFADGDIVAEWYRSEDGYKEKVVLRDDLTWSDGKPLTAHDVMFSFQVIMNEEVPIPAVRQGTDKLRWIQAYDDRTLVYWHREPSVVSVWDINFPTIPKHIYEESLKEDVTLKESEHHVKYEKAPVTGGPYKVVSRQRGQGVLLERREEWYMKDGKQIRHKPHFKQIRFKVLEDPNTRLLALKSGEIDEAELDAEEWNSKTNGADFYKNNTKVRGKEWTYYFVAWNLDSPMFEDKRTRQAMSLAMNHNEMLDDLCYGIFQPCYGMFHPDSWMFPKSPSQPLDRYNKQDLDRAEELLEQAGWSDSDGDGVLDKMVDGKLVPFEFTLVVKNAKDRVDICNLFRESLDQIGIVCNVQPMEAAAHQEKVFQKRFDAAYVGWSSGADPYTNENIFGTDEGRNFGSYSNAEVDRLFKKAMVVEGRDGRGELYGKIHELVYEDQPYMFLYNRSSFYGFNKRLRGYNFSPRGPFTYNPGIMAIWSQ